MSQGYQPQTSDITKSLLRTFVLGVLLGSFLGYSIYPMFHSSKGESPSDVESPAVAKDETPVEEPVTASPAPEVAAVPVTDVPAPQRAAGTFDADVDGFWPARHLFVGISGTTASVDTVEWLNEFKPGGVVLGPENVVDALQLSALVLQIKQAVGLGTTIADAPFIIYRGPDGALPTMAVKLDRILDVANGVPVVTAQDEARAARDHGIGVFIAPSLDLYLAGISSPEIQAISMGSQPAEVAKRGLAYMRQLRAGGVLPVATHFPGAGLSIRRSDGLWQIPADQMDGMAAGMQPFQEAIEAGLPGLLVGHMAVPGIDRDNPDDPASRSSKLLRIFLREQLHFDGVAIADDLNHDPKRGTMPLERIAVTALDNGCDAVLLESATRDDIRAICESLVRLSERRDFPAEQFKASQKRLDAWRDALAKAPAPMEPEKVVVAAQTDGPTTPVDGEEPLEVSSAAPGPESVTPPVVEAATPVPTVDPAPPAEANPATEMPAMDVTPPATGEAMVTTKVTVNAPVDETDTSKSAKTVEEAPKEAPSAPVTSEEKVAVAEEEKVAPPVEAPAPTKEEVTPSTEESTPTKDAVSPPKEVAAPAAPDMAPKVDEGEFIEHTIERGDSLLALAKKYDVSVEDLMAWNNLETKTIKYGYTLKVRPKNLDSKTVPEPAADTKSKDSAPKEEKPVPAESSVKSAEDGADEDSLETVESEPVPGSPVATDTTVEPSSDASNDVEAKSEMATLEKTPEAAAPALSGSVPAEAPVTPPVPPKKTPQPADTDKRDHVVKAGETLKSIADNFGVGVDELVGWNGFENEEVPLIAGATLIVYLPVAAPDAAPEKAPVLDLTSKKASPESDATTYQIHEVVSGDNLRRIAQKYGVTQQAIMELNKIDKPDHVQLGWKLKIPNKPSE